ncbi:MAG: amidohydrolase family protein, partial [Planctomycetes bacterium]|nr:amidohydrolase family protein [Planctomycetota bacterium]
PRERIIPFASIHPSEPDPRAAARRIAAEGIRGVKMHPMYQRFVIDDERVFPVYEAIAAEGLILVFHAGFDIGFPGDRSALPARIASVLDRIGGLRVIATHLGGWQAWDEVGRELAGRDVWLETSFSFGYLPEPRIRALIEAHGAGRVLFGSDSPWTNPADGIARLRELGLPEADLEAIQGGNAAALLAIPDRLS